EFGPVADPRDNERGVGEVRENDLGWRVDVLRRDDDIVSDLGGHSCLLGRRGWAVSTAFLRRERASGQNSDSSCRTGSSDSCRSAYMRRGPSRRSVSRPACLSTLMCWLTACWVREKLAAI